jgi:hypothetical protein
MVLITKNNLRKQNQLDKICICSLTTIIPSRIVAIKKKQIKKKEREQNKSNTKKKVTREGNRPSENHPYLSFFLRKLAIMNAFL